MKAKCVRITLELSRTFVMHLRAMIHLNGWDTLNRRHPLSAAEALALVVYRDAMAVGAENRVYDTPDEWIDEIQALREQRQELPEMEPG